MITKKMEEKFEELKCYFNAKIDESFLKCFKSLSKFKKKLKVTASICDLKPNAETSIVGIEEIKRIKPKQPRGIRTV